MPTVRARMKDGTPIILRWEDKGTSVPGFDKDGNRYEAYTTWFRAESESLNPFPEIYSQVRVSDARTSGNEGAFRVKNDDICLEAIGVDPMSIDLDTVDHSDLQHKPLPLDNSLL